MPNKNTLIQSESHDTIGNVQTVLQFLQEFHCERQFSNREANINSHVATAIMLEWVGDALSYEQVKLEMTKRQSETD
jgi:hypothetical protein